MLDERTRDREIEIDELSTGSADRVIMTIHLAVVSSRSGSKVNLADQSFILEISQGIVDGRERDTWKHAACVLKDLAGRQVFLRFADHLKDGLALLGKTRAFHILH